jgi:hypothetical protein
VQPVFRAPCLAPVDVRWDAHALRTEHAGQKHIGELIMAHLLLLRLSPGDMRTVYDR